MPLNRLGAWLLLAPALALLLLVFLFPIAWFLKDSLGSIGTPVDIWDQFVAVLMSRAVFGALVNTFWISLVVTLAVLVIGYPLAFALSRAKGLVFTAILICIVLPYFTSIIVRTYAWMVLLGRNGMINQILLWTGITSHPIDLLYNRLGVVIGMTYVLLPYMVLTLYSVMRSVDFRLLQAAEGMGAGGFTVFRRVFLPLTLHGVAAGALIVFILAIGFFVTPALMGGTGDLMIAMLIEQQVELNQDWATAALMTIVLLAVTLILYGLYSRLEDRAKGAFGT